MLRIRSKSAKRFARKIIVLEHICSWNNTNSLSQTPWNSSRSARAVFVSRSRFWPERHLWQKLLINTSLCSWCRVPQCNMKIASSVVPKVVFSPTNDAQVIRSRVLKTIRDQLYDKLLRFWNLTKRRGSRANVFFVRVTNAELIDVTGNESANDEIMCYPGEQQVRTALKILTHLHETRKHQVSKTCDFRSLVSCLISSGREDSH